MMAARPCRAAQPAVAADRFARKIVRFLAVCVVRSRQLNGNPLDGASIDRSRAMAYTVVVVPYDHQWPDLFSQVGSRLRNVLGATALRIDHIGSTAVPGLDAKPIIDVQISVAAFEPLAAYRI